MAKSLELFLPSINIASLRFSFRLLKRGMHESKEAKRKTLPICRGTVILKCLLFWGPTFYEVNSIEIACKCVPFIKTKPIPIVFI